MRKIPVGATVAAAYEFVFSRFADIAGIAWLPLVCAAVLTTAMGLAQHGYGMVGASLWQAVVGMIAEAMVAVGMLQLAFGTRASAKVYFSLDKPVWRLVSANIRGGLFLGIFGFLLLGAMFLVAWMTDAPAPWRLFDTSSGSYLIGLFAACKAGMGCHGILPALGFLAACAAAVGAFVYVSVRLMFFLPAVVVAEERISLERSWTLSQDNFWNILAIAILVCGPVAIVSWAVVYLAAVVFTGHGIWLSADALAATAVLGGMPALLIVTTVVDVVQKTISSGAIADATARSYTTVTAPPEE